MLNEPANSLIEESSRYFAACKAGNDECVKLAFALLGKAIRRRFPRCLSAIVFRLIASGDFARAKGLITALGVLPQSLDTENARAADSTRADESAFARTKMAARERSDAGRGPGAIRQGRAGARSGAAEFGLSHPGLNLPAADANAVRLQLMRLGRFTAQPEAFWGQFLRDLPRAPRTLRCAPPASGRPWEARARTPRARMWCACSGPCFDIDSAEERGCGRDPEALARVGSESKTADALREFDFAVALRIGSPIDVKGALAAIKDDTARRAADITALNHAMAEGDETDAAFPSWIPSLHRNCSAIGCWRPPFPPGDCLG